MKRRRRNPRFLPQVAPYDPLTPLVDFENPPETKRLATTTLVVGAAAAVVGAILTRQGCADAAAAPSPTESEVPCDMSDTTSACYQQNMQIMASGPGVTKQNVGFVMTVGGTVATVASLGALVGVPFFGLLVLGIPAVVAGVVISMMNTPCGKLM